MVCASIYFSVLQLLEDSSGVVVSRVSKLAGNNLLAQCAKGKRHSSKMVSGEMEALAGSETTRAPSQGL